MEFDIFGNPIQSYGIPMANAGVKAGGAMDYNNRYASLTGYGIANAQMLDDQSPFQPTMSQQIFGFTDPKTGMQSQGMLTPGMKAFGSLANAWLGMKNYGLAKDQFNFQKQAFNKNFEVQKNLTNSQLADRQRTRLQNDPSLMSVEEYMSKYGVK